MSQTKKVEKSLIAAGFGGQGLLVLGQLVAHAGIADGRNVSWLSSYGPEMRGGTANCTVIVSDDEIGAPSVTEADAVIVMNQPSLTKFKDAIKPDGILLYNSDLIQLGDIRDDIRVIAVPANLIASELGSDRVANIVMLGALVRASEMVGDSSCEGAIKEHLGAKRPELLPINLAAYEKGKATVPESDC